MAIRSMVGAMAAAMVLMAVPGDGMAQPSIRPLKSETAGTGSNKKTGILTSRLSGRQLRTWEPIERIVFARDKSGRLLHPTLHRLWQEVIGERATLFHQFSQDGGQTWSEAGRVSNQQNTAGPAGLAIDSSGRLNILQAVDNPQLGALSELSQPPLLQRWIWEGEIWTQAESQALPGLLDLDPAREAGAEDLTLRDAEGKWWRPQRDGSWLRHDGVGWMPSAFSPPTMSGTMVEAPVSGMSSEAAAPIASIHSGWRRWNSS